MGSNLINPFFDPAILFRSHLQKGILVQCRGVTEFHRIAGFPV
jgi:hypothetical protein